MLETLPRYIELSDLQPAASYFAWEGFWATIDHEVHSESLMHRVSLRNVINLWQGKAVPILSITASLSLLLGQPVKRISDINMPPTGICRLPSNASTQIGFEKSTSTGRILTKFVPHAG